MVVGNESDVYTLVMIITRFSFYLFFLATTCWSQESLLDKYFLESLKNSDQVKIISLNAEKTLADLQGTTAALLPNIDLANLNRYGNNSWQSRSGVKQVDSQVALALDWDIFRGGSELATYRLKKIIPQSASSTKDQQMAEYYAQFSRFFFQYSAAEEEKQKVEQLLKNLEKRLNLVRSRTKIGRDRKADLFALESQYERLKADYHATEGKWSQSRSHFLNFSGLKYIQSLNPNDPLFEPSNLSFAANINLDDRPELKALEFDYRRLEQLSIIAKSEYFPQINLAANYYLDQTYLGRDDWDVSLRLTLNLFDFGKNSANVQSQKISALISQSKLDFNRRNAEREWQNFQELFKQKQSEYSTLKKSLDLIKKSYAEQVKDLDKGLVGQIDVVRSLDDVISLEKLTIQSALELKSIYYQANAYLGLYPKP
jgi:outer membrane protein